MPRALPAAPPTASGRAVVESAVPIAVVASGCAEYLRCADAASGCADVVPGCAERSGGVGLRRVQWCSGAVVYIECERAAAS